MDHRMQFGIELTLPKILAHQLAGRIAIRSTDADRAEERTTIFLVTDQGADAFPEKE
jgi:hypothetical protein